MTISQITPNNGASYVDHEFMYDALGQLWMCWQHVPQNQARVARINTQTGHFLDSDDGLDLPIAASNLAPLGRVGKGPSLVRDSEGWYVVYNRLDGQNVEIWEARSRSLPWPALLPAPVPKPLIPGACCPAICA